MVILFDKFNLPDDIYETVFATKQQVIVAKLLVRYMKENGSQIGKTEMSLFATKLHEGNLITEIDEAPYSGKKVKISYNKRQFYDRILTPMKSMGIIDYNLYSKTYKLSESFNKELLRIGLQWVQELRRPPMDFKKKSTGPRLPGME
ncbi:hypothetical protein J4227_01175 [Candidatus Woesearchaeota archaeon]|nr:hypothetical protein [Candidatus Woesearchaeota archaeon]